MIFHCRLTHNPAGATATVPAPYSPSVIMLFISYGTVMLTLAALGMYKDGSQVVNFCTSLQLIQ